MSFKEFSIFSSGGYHVQWCGTKIEIFEEGNKMVISVILF